MARSKLAPNWYYNLHTHKDTYNIYMRHAAWVVLTFRSTHIGQKLEWEQIQYNCPMQQSAAPRHDDEADDGRERIQHPTSNNIVSEAGLQVNMRKIRHRFRP